MAENCKVIKREVLYVQVQVTSPLSVSSGDNEWTDSDVLRDADGNPFVTGNSLAGAMRAYLGKRRMIKIASWDLQEKMQMEMTMENEFSFCFRYVF